MSSPEPTAVAPAAEPTDAILEVLRGSSQPLTLADLRKQLSDPPSSAQVKKIVESLVSQGKLFESRSKGATPRFWDRDEDALAREQALALLRTEPLSFPKAKAELAKRLNTGASPAWCESLLNALIERGQLHRHPAGAAFKLSTEPLKLADALAPALKPLKTIAAKLAKAGITVDQLLTTLRPLLADIAPVATPSAEPALPAGAESELEELILKGMGDLDSQADGGAAVLVRELRAALPEAYRGSAFDAAVLRLAKAGRIELHRHHFSEPLPEEEARDLIRDGDAMIATISKRG